MEFVNRFEYLGMVFQTRGLAVGEQLGERVRRAKIAVGGLDKLGELSLGAAVRLFKGVIAPVATYGLGVIWGRMGRENFKKLEGVKAFFLKRWLGVARGTRNRLVYRVTGERSFIEELAEGAGERNEELAGYLGDFKAKVEGVGDEFLMTPGMCTEGWKKAGRQGRSFLMRVTMHGMHAEFCGSTGYHDWGGWCRCELCGEGVDLLHWMSCPAEKGVEIRREVGRAVRGVGGRTGRG